jgi:hypothetical protein
VGSQTAKVAGQARFFGGSVIHLSPTRQKSKRENQQWCRCEDTVTHQIKMPVVAS